jgi:shikimate kinase
MANGRSDEPTVLLVGFMASGKSTVGAELSRRTGWTLVDVDQAIEDRTGHDIPTLFATRGEAWFRELEAEVTGAALDLHGCVVVPGGGWAAVEGRLESLPPHVLSVWLRVGATEAVTRSRRDGPGRPLLDQAGDPLSRARSLLGAREPHYRKAALHLDTEGRVPVELADAILEHLRRTRPPAEREP